MRFRSLLALFFLSGVFSATAQSVQNQVANIASAAKGRVGASAVLLETGESFEYGAEGHYPMQSVYKAPIAMAVLHLVDEGNVQLDQPIKIEKSEYVGPRQVSPIRDKFPDGATLPLRDIVRYSVADSDGTASDVLLRVAGGADAVMSYLRSAGVTELMVAETELAMGRDNQAQYRNWASPRGATQFLRALHEGRGVSAASRALLFELMTQTRTFPTRIKGLLPKDTPVAHKTGSSVTTNGATAATNDMGIITLPDGHHIAVAVFVTDSRADDETRDAVIAKIARLAWDRWATAANKSAPSARE